MICQETIDFCEGNLRVKTLSEQDELLQAHRLRHKVYAETLNWVPPSEDELEVDPYDAWATPLGVFSQSGTLIGFARIVTAEGPFMLEGEFRSCLKPGYRVRRQPDTAELTRLTVDPTLAGKGLSSGVLLGVLKGMYQWLVTNQVRYCYMVVEKRFLRVLRMIGFPCEAISSGVALPPAGVVSLAAILDLDRFRIEASERRPEFLRWIATMDKVTTAAAAPVQGTEPQGIGSLVSCTLTDPRGGGMQVNRLIKELA